MTIWFPLGQRNPERHERRCGGGGFEARGGLDCTGDSCCCGKRKRCGKPTEGPSDQVGSGRLDLVLTLRDQGRGQLRERLLPREVACRFNLAPRGNHAA